MKLFTCSALSLLHADQFGKEWRDPHHLLGARQAIERELAEQSRAQGRGGHIVLRDVLRLLWLRTSASTRMTPAVRDRLVDECVQIELEQERFVSYVAPGVHNLLRQHDGQRLAFIADSAVGASELALLLHFHGLRHCAERGVTTADLESSGEAATLFEHAQRRFKATPSEWVHHGDAAAAERLGANALGVVTKSQETAIGAGLPSIAVAPEWELQSSLPDAKTVALGTYGADFAADDPTALEMMQIGIEAAPLFAGFALWILEQALQRKSEHIYFFTREGHFFAQIYELVSGVYDSGIPSPPYSVLSVSRLSTFAPSLNELHPSSFNEVWSLYKPQSVAGMFATLGIETLYDERELASFDLSIGERIEHPESDPRIMALLGHPPFRDRVMTAIGEMRSRLTAYLASEGLDQRARTVSTVDIGWRGSIQSNIARLYPATTFHGLYLGLDKRKPTTGTNATKNAYVVDLQRSVRNSDLVTYVAPMEFLCGTSFGSTVGYAMGQMAEPIRMSVDAESQAAFLNVVAPFQAGVLAGTADFAREMRAHSLASKDLLAEAVAAWQRLVRYPNRQMANGFAETTVDETFGFGRTFRLPREVAIVRDRSGFAEGPSVTTIVQDTVRSIPWPQAFAHYARTSGVMKYIMPAAVRVAKRGRRLQSQLRGILERKEERG